MDDIWAEMTAAEIHDDLNKRERGTTSSGKIAGFQLRSLALALLPVVIAPVAMAATGERPVSPFIVKRSELSNQFTRPFMVAGTEFTPEAGMWPKYQEYIEEFPDARACLKSSAFHGDTVDLDDFAWERPENWRGSGSVS